MIDSGEAALRQRVQELRNRWLEQAEPNLYDLGSEHKKPVETAICLTLRQCAEEVNRVLAEGRAQQEAATVAELSWVLNRAEEIVRYEHGKVAAYAFEQAWGELPEELRHKRT